MKHKYIILTFLSILVLSANFVSVKAAELEDLPDAGLTPQSSYYFLDRFGDWVKLNIFTFNAVRKAEVRAGIAEERLAELNEVSEKTPEQTDIIEKLEEKIQEIVEKVNNETESLDGKNKDISRLMEILNSFSLKRHEVLERAMEKASDEAKDKIEKALENVYEQAEKRREILLKQKEKGFISEEKARLIIENNLTKLKEQLERRKERIEEIEDEALKERLENIIEKKLEALENEILELESNDNLKEVRENIREIKKEAIKSILQTRQELRLHSTTTEEVLEEIHEDRLDLKARVLEIIKEVEEKISDIEEKINQLKADGVSVPASVDSLLTNGKKHLENGKAALGEEKIGRAFGQAMAALKNVRNAQNILERVLKGYKELPEKILGLKEDLAEIKGKIESLGQAIPEEIKRLFREAEEEINKVESLLSESDFREAWRHFEIAKKIIKKLEHFLDRLEEGEELIEETIERQREILKDRLERVKDILRFKRLDEREELIEKMPEPIRPKQGEGIICAQVLTPARNIKTKECRVFKNSCLAEGWQRDLDCREKENNELKTRLDSPGSETTTDSLRNFKGEEDTPRDEMTTKTIDLTAKQWEFSPNPIKVKKGTKVILNIKSIDVNHGFSLPEFNVSIDLKPGKTEKAEFLASKSGRFPFKCSVFCGAGHQTMTGALIIED